MKIKDGQTWLLPENMEGDMTVVRVLKARLPKPDNDHIKVFVLESTSPGLCAGTVDLIHVDWFLDDGSLLS